MNGFGQQVNIKQVDVGAYGIGSSVAVPIKINDQEGKLKTNHIFRLYLSDASGSFVNATEIGSHQGFYATFINGTIPTGLPAGDYRVLVKYGENLSSEPSNTFKIIAQQGVKADITAHSSQTITENPKTFGVCQPERSAAFRFTNTSTPEAKVELKIVNEATQSMDEFEFSSSSITINAEMTHYTIFAKAELNGVVATRAFFLINNIIKPGFSAPANSTICLPAELQYDIETKSVNGIQNNFPGYSYQVNWGDGLVEEITPNKIIAESAQIKHTYLRSSCGKQIKINDVNYYNVYGIIYQVKSPYCGLISVPISTQSKVLTPPENRFGLPETVCINTNLIIPNRSLAGENPSSNTPECTNNNAVYYWFVDDVAVTPQGVSLNYELKHIFKTPGFHKVRLESQSFSGCEAIPITKTCFVQLATEPAFTLSDTLACAGSTIKATDASVIDPDVAAQNIYKWTVDGPYATGFANGTSSSDKNPEFLFKEPGIYKVKLTILSPCKPETLEQTVIINGAPSISTKWQTELCGKDQLFSFGEDAANVMQTIFAGTAKAEAGTYTWEINGGAFSFKNNSNKNSKMPTVLFEDYGIYTIRITHQNNCATETITKTLTFNEAPTVSAGLDQVVCANSEIALVAVITGDFNGEFSWTGGEGEFFPSRKILNPVYKPTPAEILSGEVLLTFSIKTDLAAPCNVVEDAVAIKIQPENKVTSAANKEICTSSSVNYQPTALLQNSTFTWTTVEINNVTGFSESGRGSIRDVLSTVNPEAEGSIIYSIIPYYEGCAGEPFRLELKVLPQPIVHAIASEVTICSGKIAVIKLSSNFKDMRYTWKSTVVGKISGNSQNNTPKSLEEITDALTNAGDITGSVTYTIIPQNSIGCVVEPITVTVKVSASEGLSTFSPDKTVGCSPLKITFKNSNKGADNTYRWDFGDGQTLVTKDNNTVNHTYYSGVAKTIKAKLITETDCGSYSSEYVIKISPSTVEAALVVNGDEYEGCAPHTVNFHNNSVGAVNYRYDFGDGTIIETNASPEIVSHTFKNSGSYVVKMTASNGCSDTTVNQTIKVRSQAITAFTSDVDGACDSVTVKFRNQSSNALSYLWEFGDGTVSTEINPTHTFNNKKENYTIRLTSFSSFGCAETLEKVDYISVGANAKTDFVVSPGLIIAYPKLNFTFRNESVGDIASYHWDFGDGQTSLLKNPEHSYADTGHYKVQLIVLNKNGCSNSISKTVNIVGTPGNLFIPNAFMPNSLVDEIRSFRAKGSGLSNWHMRIFNKWGQLIWETTQLDSQGRPQEAWSGIMFGGAAPQGVYFWEVSAKFINGTEWPGMIYGVGSDPKKAGTLNLIR